jgi:hypothetical protein
VGEVNARHSSSEACLGGDPAHAENIGPQPNNHATQKITPHRNALMPDRSRVEKMRLNRQWNTPAGWFRLGTTLVEGSAACP